MDVNVTQIRALFCKQKVFVDVIFEHVISPHQKIPPSRWVIFFVLAYRTRHAHPFYGISRRHCKFDHAKSGVASFYAILESPAKSKV